MFFPHVWGEASRGHIKVSACGFLLCLSSSFTCQSLLNWPTTSLVEVEPEESYKTICATFDTFSRKFTGSTCGCEAWMTLDDEPVTGSIQVSIEAHNWVPICLCTDASGV